MIRAGIPLEQWRQMPVAHRAEYLAHEIERQKREAHRQAHEMKRLEALRKGKRTSNQPDVRAALRSSWGLD